MSDQAPTDDEVFAHFHDVKIDHDNIAHYRGLMAKKLVMNRCDDCGNWIYPHRPMCPKCLSWNVTPTQLSGKGRLYMYTLIMQSRDPDNPLLEPIPAAAIELAEQPGLRYLSRMVNCDAGALVHDMPVELTWIEEQGRFWPGFQPTGIANV
jgi:uncharacterized protein